MSWSHLGALPCANLFSWNAGMVLPILKGDPTKRDLEHVQVDDQGMVYLFFYDKQGCRGDEFIPG